MRNKLVTSRDSVLKVTIMISCLLLTNTRGGKLHFFLQDTTFVEHVVNYDFPNYVSDYIHRCGRVGRVGSSLSSHATSFVTFAYEAPMVREIEEAARRTAALNNVNANITRKINARFGLEPGDLNPNNQVPAPQQS